MFRSPLPLALVLLISRVRCISSGENGHPQQLFGNSFGVPFVNASYDYVVIGGGTAGLAVAWKLALEGKYQVAVVEAGGFYQIDNGNGSVVPGLDVQQHIGWDSNHPAPLIDWGFVTEPQRELEGRALYYARGKTLGGSSARAHGAFMRGTKGTYQKWADEVGDPAYEFENFLPYFKSSCTLTPPSTKRWPTNGTVKFDQTAFADGKSGPLQISWPNWAVPLGTWAEVGFEASGIARSPTGFSSGNLDGHGWAPATIDPVNSHRSSSQTSFLADALSRTSLKVYTRTTASRVVFNQSTAVGVDVQTEGISFNLFARKEVIVSAGAFKSPQLLMLSGIGPADHLRQHGISVLKDLPGVGQNLQDRTYGGISFRVNVETSSMLVNSAEYAAKAASDFLASGTGPLTNGIAFTAFERLHPETLSKAAQNSLAGNLTEDWPHIEYLVENGFSGDNRDYSTADPADGYNYGTISAALAGPLSRGNVTLRSSNPLEPPVIDPNYFSDPVDKELAIAAFKRIRQVWSGMSGVTIGDEYFPGTTKVQTDEEIFAHISRTNIQLWHASATCKMGRSSDPMAVVDAQSRVFGVHGLRVVDVSAFPLLPAGHPMATVSALALKVANDILRSSSGEYS